MHETSLRKHEGRLWLLLYSAAHGLMVTQGLYSVYKPGQISHQLFPTHAGNV